MPLGAATLYALGLFGENDHVSLSPSLSVYKRKLYDHATGAQHQLHPLAEDSVLRLAKGVIFHKWLIYMLENQLTFDEIDDIIFFLNGIGAIAVKRSFKDGLRITGRQIKAQLKGVPISTLGRRSQFGIRNMSISIASAMRLLVIAVAISSALLYGSGFAELGESLAIALAFLSIILVSTLSHEYGHAFAIPGPNKKLFILQRGLRLSVLHRPLPPSEETKVSLSGPLAGGVSAILVGCATYLLLHSAVYFWIGIIIAIFHLFSLLPAYADGLSLKLAFSRRKI